MAEKNPLFFHMKEICKELGQEKIASIHKKNILLDWLPIVLTPSLFLWLAAFLTIYTGYDYVRKKIHHAID